jgi:hypothetical protein
MRPMARGPDEPISPGAAARPTAHWHGSMRPDWQFWCSGSAAPTATGRPHVPRTVSHTSSAAFSVHARARTWDPEREVASRPMAYQLQLQQHCVHCSTQQERTPNAWRDAGSVSVDLKPIGSGTRSTHFSKGSNQAISPPHTPSQCHAHARRDPGTNHTVTPRHKRFVASALPPCSCATEAATTPSIPVPLPIIAFLLVPVTSPAEHPTSRSSVREEERKKERKGPGRPQNSEDRLAPKSSSPVREIAGAEMRQSWTCVAQKVLVSLGDDRVEHRCRAASLQPQK